MRSPFCSCCAGVHQPAARGSRPAPPATARVGASQRRSYPRGQARPRRAAARRDRRRTPDRRRPRKGSPTRDTVTVTGRSAKATIRSTRATASSSVALPLRSLKVSVAASVQLTRSSDVAANRSYPRSLSTSPESSASPCRASATTSSASAICGTRSPRTNDTASTRARRAEASREISSARVAAGRTSGSFCRPSRGPTSQTRTRSVTPPPERHPPRTAPAQRPRGPRAPTSNRSARPGRA